MRPSTSTRGILDPRAMERAITLERVEPSADLAPLVERYWIVRWSLPPGARHVQEVLPHPTVNLALEEGTARVHGVGTRVFRADLRGEGAVFGVKFRPGGFHPFLGRPVSGITDRVITLDELWGEPGGELYRDVFSRRTTAARVARVEALLRRRRTPPEPAVADAARAVTIALERRDLTRAEDLAAAVGVSLRALQRMFHRYVGVTPKWTIRRLRIHEAAERIALGRLVDHATLAQDLGYFDQAHFVRDFRAQVGATPGEYAARCGRSV